MKMFKKAYRIVPRITPLPPPMPEVPIFGGGGEDLGT